jgi:hypothetical protein
MAIKHATLLDHYLWHMCDSIRSFERTEVDYKAVIEEYERRHGPSVTADYAAADDPRFRQAIGDGAWYRDRSRTFALGAIALMLHEQHYPQGGPKWTET